MADPPPTAVALEDPTSCQLEHRGSPQEPAALLLSCGERAWEVPNPGTKEQGLALAPQGEGGWTVTQAVVVEGEGRLWYRDEALTCLATRDLLDTAGETRVRCRPVEATDGPLPTLPGPIPA